MSYAKVSWHDGYGFITTVTDTNNLVIVTVNGNNIDVGDTYTIKYARYTVPTTGKYLVKGSVTYNNAVADQRYAPVIFKSTGGAVPENVSYQSIGIASNFAVIETIGILSCTAGDLLSLGSFNTPGVTTVDIYGNASNKITRFEVFFLGGY
jgi:hypothetical protein